MILDTSYSDKETTRKINNAVGKPFAWRQRWKLGGIGSRRMTIHEISEEYQQYINEAHYISQANIELRPLGIILHFRHKLQAYSWIMPYSTLTIYFKQVLRLESEGKFIQFNEPENDRFIMQMIDLQNNS